MEAAAPSLASAAAAAVSPPPPPPSVAAAYSDSVESSPRSRQCEAWDPQPPPPLTSSSSSSKLRLMCSYGGHIVPRPHDRYLCYLGGTTRIVVVDRHTTLSSLHSKLSFSLLDGRPFSLKYQLPNEDLDSLISVSIDEDLDNMIDEYDRLLLLSSSTSSSSAAASKHPPRLRLFLFPPSKPDSASSLGSLVDDSKSESWFVDALNGGGILPRGLSPDSSADVNSLLGLELAASAAAASTAKPPESPPGKRGQEIHSVPDSPLMETSSSFGSTSSATCLSNLPPIRVRVEQPRLAGLEEHFAQINAGDEGSNRGVSGDDERPEQGLPANFRKPPHPAPKLIQNELSSDSVLVSSDLAGVALNSQQKTGFYQDAIASVSAASFVSDLKPDLSDPTYRIPVQLPEQQFVHAAPHYIHHQTSGPVPISSYYQMHHPHPMYFVPVGQSQAYNLHLHPTLGDPTPISTSKPPLPTPHIIPAAAPKPEPATTLYRTAATTPAAQPLPAVAPVVNLSDQQQQQYVGYHHLHHPGQSPAPAASFAYEFADPLQAQVYYTQPASAALAPQYQTMTSAAMIPEIPLLVHANVDTLLNKTSQAL